MVHFLTALAIAALVALDRITKYAAAVNIGPGGSISLIDGVFSLTYLENKGAAFGLFEGGRWFFVALTSLVLAAGIYFYRKLPRGAKGGWRRVALILIGGGAIGNFIDRMLYGTVVDFLYFELINFPVFNVADICVVCGTILLAALVLLTPDAKQSASADQVTDEGAESEPDESERSDPADRPADNG